MRHRSLLSHATLLCVCFFLFSACSTQKHAGNSDLHAEYASASCRPVSPEVRAAIDEVAADFSAAYVANDMDRLAGTYLPDAAIMPPGKRITGWQGIRDYFRWQEGRQQLAHQMQSESLRQCGDLVLDWGRWWSRASFNGNPPREFTGRYFMVWQRNAAGDWRIAEDMWQRAE